MVVVDVAFTTMNKLVKTRELVGQDWDSSEFYWAADETSAALDGTGLTLRFTPVSFCAGIFLVEPCP